LKVNIVLSIYSQILKIILNKSEDIEFEMSTHKVSH